MKRITIGLIILVSATVVFAGGSSEDTSSGSEIAWVLDESDDAMLPGVNPLEVKGNIIAAGSSTVYPLSERMVERFKDEGFSGLITVDSIGSGAGFERFTKGETDISNASRPIKDKEVAAARKTLPTSSLPRPVRSAIASALRVNRIAAPTITATEMAN